jgi:hypothetical protein
MRLNIVSIRANAIMDDRIKKQKELERRERELEKREQALRLREMERELYDRDPPMYQTVPYQKPEGKLKRWYKKAVKIAKFIGIVIVGIVAVHIGAWLAGVLIVGGLAWLSYKVLFDSDD